MSKIYRKSDDPEALPATYTSEWLHRPAGRQFDRHIDSGQCLFLFFPRLSYKNPHHINEYFLFKGAGWLLGKHNFCRKQNIMMIMEQVNEHTNKHSSRQNQPDLELLSWAPATSPYLALCSGSGLPPAVCRTTRSPCPARWLTRDCPPPKLCWITLTQKLSTR